MPMSVDIDRLRLLLARGAESDDLEFKSTWDPQQKSDRVELCKDIAAIESLSDGGYIVVGADDHGAPSGTFAPEQARDFDEQKIRSKVAAVLGEPIDLSAALHRIESNDFLLIGIGSNRDGMRIMPKDGEYENNTIWRAADVFVRRGTSSVRWNQHEARGIIERVIAARKEEWRRDIFETIRIATPAFEPGGFVNVNVEMPAESFGAAVTELIRRGDEVGLDLLLRKTISNAVAVADAGAGKDARAVAAELSDQLDRLDIIAALSSRYPAGAAFSRAMVGYRDIYEAVDEDFVSQPNRFPLGHKEVLMHLYAVGAVLVHEKQWENLAILARLTPISTHGGYWKSLLRKAEVMVARAELLKDEEGTRSGVIEAAKPVAAHLFDLLGGGQPRDLTNLLVEFDVYRGIANAGKDENEKLGAYTNFALYYSARAEPAFLTLLDDAVARAALFDGTDAELSAVYRHMNSAASSEAFAYNGWDGFENSRLVSFAGTTGS
ncbi:ATP-binding protein [Cryobacterium sp. MDB1-18-2]|uniref:ATP-binding protein n=1 Tax=unclassified Cryobacterium TaxID=2649013 RepID=UPI0010697CF9|nr:MULTISPECIES: ATP-binding protein [unclassified Cryobacterium]TFC27617.1 ATP-binding protein [Cryobacterium sp. MDB1-18-2]TFC45856.1 ATP-binding protein [Cryobacterium sp. MDB1-18-1]